MKQLEMNFESLDIIYMESENDHDRNIVSSAMKQELFRSKLSYKATRKELKEWFCSKFFSFDLEVSCDDLFEIGIENGIQLRL